MGYKIKINKMPYIGEVQKLGDFLISDKTFFNVFIRSINVKKNDISAHIENRYVSAKIVTKEKYDEFNILWNNFNAVVKSGKAKQGDLLEYIVTKIKKPLKLDFKNLDYENECIIYDGESLVNICSNNCNVDVVLYNLDNVTIDEDYICFEKDIEFLECKQDINTFVYILKGDRVNKHTQDKLTMFKELNTKINRDDVKYIFPSFVAPGRFQINYLKRKGYDFIDIVDGAELESIFFAQ
ncbi:hypothetical protein [Candidatus Clostridium helianthi]|uniref:Uncharacterized protein n=1 Tax=Candidatus Clostridium helianthi TaxID=3381660 RepID=A0ABW8RZD8_9CLOT